MNIEETILNYIIDDLYEDDDPITKDTSLFDDGVLDSLNLISLITFLEKTYKIKIKTSEVILENLDSVTKMLAFLEKKTS